MKKLSLFVLTLSMAAPALAVRTYQVTAPILEITETKVVLQKGKEKWELDITPMTRMNSDLADMKVGEKVVIEYTMVTQTMAIKPASAPKSKPAKAKK